MGTWFGKEGPVRESQPKVDEGVGLLTVPPGQAVIGEQEVRKAAETLKKYKAGKANLERRLIEDERWYQMRHWEMLRGKDDGKGNPRPEPSSAWLFNVIMNKHADAMDNYPEAGVLPRERGDEGDAKTLSAILPVIMEQCGHEQVYSENWWEKLKHGTGAYGIFWNTERENGLGDVDITRLDLLNVFWEPGVEDIQRSRNLFIVAAQDDDLLEAEYPQLRGKLGGTKTVEVAKYVYDDQVDTEHKSVVVDWYYKVRAANGRTLLHYAKFVGETLLFASENDPRYREAGWYGHGEYPVVFDTLFPEKGTPVGFGYVALCKSPQMYIDKLDQNIMENALINTRTRYLAARGTGVNKKQLLDLNEPVVEVEGGSLEERKLMPIEAPKLDGIYVTVRQMKVDEMKETSSNRDVSNGGTASGVTAAAAIAALQEAGNKSSRDMISASYRAYTRLNYLVIELIRQFYDEQRSFRITGAGGQGYDFVDYSNAGIRDQEIGVDERGVPMYRRPVFDIVVKAQKKTPYSRLVQNELAKELYGAGFFDPQRAQEAMGALELMDFEGKDKVVEQVKEGETLLNVCKQLSEQMEQLKMAVGLAQAQQGAARQTEAENRTARPGGEEAAARAKEEVGGGMTGYGKSLAMRSGPDMNIGAV